MSDRHLTITLQRDWPAALSRAGDRALAGTYRGETLNFESPGMFLARLTEKRWALVRALQGQGKIPKYTACGRFGAGSAPQERSQNNARPNSTNGEKPLKLSVTKPALALIVQAAFNASVRVRRIRPVALKICLAISAARSVPAR